MKRLRPVAATLLALAIVASFVAIEANLSAADDMALALTGAKIYESPDAKPLTNGVVLIRGNKIAAVGTASAVRVPADAKILDCSGLVVTAGFQNSHIHFTEPKWDNAAKQPPAKLSQQLAEMLTQYGFTTVVDTGSLLANTAALRSRIESGEISGPRIMAAGEPIYPSGGTPFYLKGALPPVILAYIESNLEPTTPAGATAVVQRDVAGGADVIKLFTGSLTSPTEIKPMPLDIAAAAVREAHRQNRLVFAHPSNIEGLTVALDAGVDVLAHTTPRSGKWDDALIVKMKAHRMSLIPTLKLWIYESHKAGQSDDQAQQFAEAGAAELGQYERAGGQILFGTDVGYMLDYDTVQEYALMGRGGLSPMQILAALTTAPAARFNEESRRGRIAAGMDADLVVLNADPAQDVRNFAKVRYT